MDSRADIGPLRALKKRPGHLEQHGLSAPITELHHPILISDHQTKHLKHHVRGIQVNSLALSPKCAGFVG